MEWRKESRFDLNALIRAGLLLALSTWIIKLLAAGELRWYVNPKFTYFTASATLGLGLMAWGQLVQAFGRPGGAAGRIRWRLYMAVAAVLGLGFSLKPVVFSADLAAKQGMNLTRRAGEPAPATAAPVAAPPPADDTRSPAPSPVQTVPSATPTQAEPIRTPAAAQPAAPATPDLVITQKNFVSVMNEIYFGPASFAGKRVAIEGFTFHPPETQPEVFAVIRLVVTCHVAHAAPDGLLAVGPGDAKPPQDQWVRAEGVLEPVVHNGTPTVRLRVERLVPIAKPADPYVYP